MKTPDTFDEGWNKAVDGVTPAELDAKGEEAVRYALAKGEYGKSGSDGHNIVLSWLALKDSRRADESLSIARKALIFSMIAIIFSVIAMRSHIDEFIQWFLQK